MSKQPGQPGGQEEPTFSIQPHPAKTNDPSDLQSPNLGGDKSSAGGGAPAALAALQGAISSAPGAQVLSNEQLSKLPEAESKEALEQRAKELNA